MAKPRKVVQRGDLTGRAGAPEVVRARGLRESGGTTLSMGAVGDGEFLKRSGSSIVGDAGGGGGGLSQSQVLARGLGA